MFACVAMCTYIYTLICVYIYILQRMVVPSIDKTLQGTFGSQVQDLLDTAVSFHDLKLHPHYPHYMYITITIRWQLQVHRHYNYNYNFITLHTQVCDMCVCVSLRVCLFVGAFTWMLKVGIFAKRLFLQVSMLTAIAWCNSCAIQPCNQWVVSLKLRFYVPMGTF